MTNVECLFNKWLNTPDGRIESFGLKAEQSDKKCQRCGQTCALKTWTGHTNAAMAAFIQVNRPTGCNGEVETQSDSHYGQDSTSK